MFPRLTGETDSYLGPHQASGSHGGVSAWAIADYVDGWVDGWTRSREAARPEAVDGGWYVATGTPEEPQRFVLSEPTPERLAALLEQGQPPLTCVKLPGEPG